MGVQESVERVSITWGQTEDIEGVGGGCLGCPPPNPTPVSPGSHLAEVLDVEEVEGAEESMLREPEFVSAGGQESADVPQAQELWWHRGTITTIIVTPIVAPIVTTPVIPSSTTTITFAHS